MNNLEMLKQMHGIGWPIEPFNAPPPTTISLSLSPTFFPLSVPLPPFLSQYSLALHTQCGRC